MIKLDTKFLLNSGHKRDIYQYPEDETKIIKIQKTKEKLKDDNYIEKIYYAHLQKREISFEKIAKFYGEVQTSRGKGLVFEKITDYDKKVSRTLDEVISKNLISKNELIELINALGKYLKKNRIVFADISFANIMVWEYQKDKFDLKIIDGLGSALNDFRFQIRMRLGMYERYKATKQWKWHLSLSRIMDLK